MRTDRSKVSGQRDLPRILDWFGKLVRSRGPDRSSEMVDREEVTRTVKGEHAKRE